MREQYTQQLEAYYDSVVKLGNIVNEAVHKSIQAYNNNDKVLAEEIIKKDNEINDIVVEIETEAYRLIALQQPVTSDLRKVFTVLLASTDLERIADHAAAIAKAVTRFSDEETDVKAINEILNNMFTVVEQMLTDVVSSFTDKEIESAKLESIALRDDEVDALLKKLYGESSRRMKKNNEIVNYGIGHINIGTSLERIGDYTTNICERLIYLETGELVELNVKQ